MTKLVVWKGKRNNDTGMFEPTNNYETVITKWIPENIQTVEAFEEQVVEIYTSPEITNIQSLLKNIVVNLAY